VILVSFNKSNFIFLNYVWVGSRNSNSEAENSKGGKQEPGNVEKSGQETTRPEKKNGGGDVSAEVESEDEGPGPSKSRNFKNLRSGKRKNETGFPLNDTSSSSNEQVAEDGGCGKHIKYSLIDSN
jgi:hypothetical protein